MGLLAYVVTQFFKLLFIAIIMTPSPIWDHLIDCFGIYWFMIKQQKASVAQVKILSNESSINLNRNLNSLLIN